MTFKNSLQLEETFAGAWRLEILICLPLFPFPMLMGRKALKVVLFVDSFGRKSKAFQAASGTTNSAIIANMTKTEKSMVGLSLNVETSQSHYSRVGVGAQTPCGMLACDKFARLRSASRGTLTVPGLNFNTGPSGGLGEHVDAVSRQLILTKVSLVERLSREL